MNRFTQIKKMVLSGLARKLASGFVKLDDWIQKYRWEAEQIEMFNPKRYKKIMSEIRKVETRDPQDPVSWLNGWPKPGQSNPAERLRLMQEAAMNDPVKKPIENSVSQETKPLKEFQT